MKIQTIDFCGSFKELDKMPKDNLPEIAFIGRSTVGKSSIINNFLNATVAKTSSTPGKTQLINFFKINKKFYLVDLPGYGYAAVSAKTKAEWQGYIEKYLANRETLKAVVLLLDIRHKPNSHDMTLIQWMQTLIDIEKIFVLTKSDKLSRSNIFKHKAMIAKELFISQHELIPHSSASGDGRHELHKRIEKALDAQKIS